ncbi:hypothetical protein BC832DRAFT_564133 [Gaertneriomyces semiglobifer]|nr:hypothetical protein BC832DRAFT_564133 [Gaertneriomyces semiglobifer]
MSPAVTTAPYTASAYDTYDSLSDIIQQRIKSGLPSLNNPQQPGLTTSGHGNKSAKVKTHTSSKRSVVPGGRALLNESDSESSSESESDEEGSDVVPYLMNTPALETAIAAKDRQQLPKSQVLPLEVSDAQQQQQSLDKQFLQIHEQSELLVEMQARYIRHRVAVQIAHENSGTVPAEDTMGDMMRIFMEVVNESKSQERDQSGEINVSGDGDATPKQPFPAWMSSLPDTGFDMASLIAPAHSQLASQRASLVSAASSSTDNTYVQSMDVDTDHDEQWTSPRIDLSQLDADGEVVDVEISQRSRAFADYLPTRTPVLRF